MIIIREKDANSRVSGRIDDALSLEYRDSISTEGGGPTVCVAEVVSMALDSMARWVYSRRSIHGQQLLVPPSKKHEPVVWDKTVDARLYGMEKVLKAAKRQIEAWEK